jgi:hypothetical protein
MRSDGSLTTAPAYPEAGPPIIGVVGGGAALFSTFGPVEMQFQPGGFAAGTVLLELTPNADNSTYSAKLSGGATFTNGIFTGNGLVQRSLAFNLDASVLSSNVQTGNITGTFSITGTPYGGSAQVTLSGPISGPYFGTLAP